MAEINRSEINIITVEDPVEYRLPGINQVQINNRAGLTFAAALRTILRSDPDVIMVGEIRDAETAKISIESALTGHFVLSTLHTNDAPGAVTRLTEMGVEPFLVGSAVSAVLAQRLARKLCTNCCEMYVPTPEELAAARITPEVAAQREGMVLYRKVGCPRCNRTGYRGRIGIFQLLVMNDELEKLASAGAPRDAIEREAMDERHALALGRRHRQGLRGADVARRARARRDAVDSSSQAAGIPVRDPRHRRRTRRHVAPEGGRPRPVAQVRNPSGFLTARMRRTGRRSRPLIRRGCSRGTRAPGAPRRRSASPARGSGTRTGAPGGRRRAGR